ncbi:MAG: hypothetical protein ABI770_04515 [Sphingomicrobium sp.]
MGPPESRSRRPIRRDGWTAERQLRFLDALAETRSIGKAAAAAGMSRESAYRLRPRREGALFAALWGRALAFEPIPAEVHIEALTNGQIMRLLGNHYRRERGEFLGVPSRRAGARGT